MSLKTAFPHIHENKITPGSTFSIYSCPRDLLFNLVNKLRKFMFQIKLYHLYET